jgi:hypothetical protein
VPLKLISFPVLPTGRNFCRKTQKWPRKFAAEFSADLPKNSRTGAIFFEVSFAYKILIEEKDQKI